MRINHKILGHFILFILIELEIEPSGISVSQPRFVSWSKVILITFIQMVMILRCAGHM